MAVSAVDPRVPRWYRAARGLVRITIRAWFRPRVLGAEQVPLDGPVILAPIHRSFIDFAFSALVTDRKLFFMAKGDLWRSRPLGWLLDHLGVFPVNREAADRASVRTAEAVLDAGQLLVLFPEGARRQGAQVGELMEGAAFLAARSGATVVPLGIGGSDLAMPKGTAVPRRVPVTVVVGEPIPPPPRGASGRVPRSSVRRASQVLRAGIQDAYDAARADVRSGGSAGGRGSAGGAQAP